MIKIGKKKYIIKSKSRFLIFIIIVLILAVSIISTLMTLAGWNDVLGMAKQDIIEIQIEPGDTLWEIAGEYMPENMDRRKAVHILCRTNHISASELYVGQVLKIPKDFKACSF